MSGGRELIEPPCEVVIVKTGSSESNVNESKERSEKKEKHDKASRNSGVNASVDVRNAGIDRLFAGRHSSQIFIKNSFPSRNMSGGKVKSRKKKGSYCGFSGGNGVAYGGLSVGGYGVKTSASCHSLSRSNAHNNDNKDEERLKLISGHHFSSSSSFLSAISRISLGRMTPKTVVSRSPPVAAVSPPPSSLMPSSASPKMEGKFGGSNSQESNLRRSCSVTLAFPTDRRPSADVSKGWLEGVASSRPSSPVNSRRSSGLHLALPQASYHGGNSSNGWRKTGGMPEGTVDIYASACQLQQQQNKGSRSLLMNQRGSFLAINHNAQECRESMLSINYPEYSDEEEDVSLVYTRLEKIPMKDFAAEIRAHLDVEQFLSQAQLMLDVHETDLKQILYRMLHHLMDHEESVSAFQEASRTLFTDATAHQLSKSIQCTCSSYGGSYDYDQSWICVLCTAATVQKRHVAIARLKSPANLGRTCQEVWFIIMVVTSTKEKGTKNALETGRTFATLFADIDLRLRLLGARNETEFKQIMWEHMKELAEEQCVETARRRMSTTSNCKSFHQESTSRKCWIGRGIKEDLERRLPHYLSDFKDGFIGDNTLHKTISTTFFLYFACILPAIALGVLNYKNTNGKIDVTKAIYSQTIGGLFFSLIGGQPMVVLLTTAPLALYTKVIYNICQLWDLDFLSMFACTGLWNSFFLLIYAFTDASKLMQWCTRSTEEIFAIFISLAFAFDAFKDVVADFQENYNSPNCAASSSFTNTSSSSSPLRKTSSSSSPHHASTSTKSNDYTIGNTLINAAAMGSVAGESAGEAVKEGSGFLSDCLKENSLLYLLLMLATVWLGLSLYNFTKTPFLNASKRELLADCALPVSVILTSFFGSYVFKEVKLKKFQVIDKGELFKLPRDMLNLEWPVIMGAMALGFCLSLLFFMDQNTASSIVNSPDNRLKKGPAYHWDLVVIALINAILSFLGLPMVHGALPHSPLHVRAMADKEDRVYQGRVHLKIVSVRETRVTGILSHILIGLSVHFIDKLQSIPRPVLDGLFLYLAITALHSNQMFERIMLLVTEQAAYPPNHYIRTVPQRKIHLFTFIQLLQLAILCGFGFAPVPYLKMVFPILHFVMLPIRHKLVPYLFEKKFLQSLDGH